MLRAAVLRAVRVVMSEIPGPRRVEVLAAAPALDVTGSNHRRPCRTPGHMLGSVAPLLPSPSRPVLAALMLNAARPVGQRRATGLEADLHVATPLGLATHRSSCAATMFATGCRYVRHQRHSQRLRVLSGSADVAARGGSVIRRSDKSEGFVQQLEQRVDVGPDAGALAS